jgi:uncharacterized phiE125 gp8 family phage protein
VGLKLETAPSEEPVTLDELRDHCRVFGTAEDDLLVLRGKAARRWCEAFTFRQFVTATFRLSLDGFPREFSLPRPPLVSVEEITYIDVDGVEQELDDSAYRVDTVGEPGRVQPAYGTCWPSARRVAGSVQVVLDAGFGAAAAVPEEFKAAILIVAADLHLHREDTIVGASIATIDAAKRLLRPRRCLAVPLEYQIMEAA